MRSVSPCAQASAEKRSAKLLALPALSQGVRVAMVLTTHRHHDHSGGNHELVRRLEEEHAAATAAEAEAAGGEAAPGAAESSGEAVVQILAGDGCVPGVTRVLGVPGSAWGVPGECPGSAQRVLGVLGCAQ